MQDLTNIKGLSDLDKLLDTLPIKLEKNIMRGGMRAGMKVVMVDAKARAAKASGTMANGLKLSTRNVGTRVYVYLRTAGRHGYIAHWVEFGTRAHRITAKNRKSISFGGMLFQSVQHPGAKPEPFMRPAMDSKAGEAVVAAGNYIKKRLATKEGLDTADIEVKDES